MNEWEALQETLFWLSQDVACETVALARTELANGNGLTEEQMRAEFGVPQRTA